MSSGYVGSVVVCFDCRSRGPWFESYTDLTWISQGTRNELDQCVNWYLFIKLKNSDSIAFNNCASDKHLFGIVWGSLHLMFFFFAKKSNTGQYHNTLSFGYFRNLIFTIFKAIYLPPVTNITNKYRSGNNRFSTI